MSALSATEAIDMQQEFLKIAGKQTENWLAVAKTGKVQKGDGLIGAAREGITYGLVVTVQMGQSG